MFDPHSGFPLEITSSSRLTIICGTLKNVEVVDKLEVECFLVVVVKHPTTRLLR